MYGLQLVLYAFLSSFLGTLNSDRHCEFQEQFLKYHKVRVCYKSTLPMIARAITSNMEDCMKFARHRKALAFNFSPEDASDYRNFSSNCQILGCPEIEKSLTLVADVAFDYYSAYGNWNMTENATCIRSVGLFALIENKHNYTASIEKCQDAGAELANVLSEVRTNHLSQYINDTLQDWYRVAYVGLDDIQEEGNFRTSSGMMLRCYRYRAWGPGHPRSKYKNEDCVVLDSDRMWRVVKCKTKLPALCEFQPAEPMEEAGFQNLTCDQISNEDKRKACNSKQMVVNMYNNATRMDNCSIVHDIYGNIPDD